MTAQKDKDPKRVRAGKKAWAAMSAVKKGKIRAALKRGRASRSKGGGAAKAASKPSGGGRTGKKNKPSWFTRVRAFIATVIGLGGVWDAVGQATQAPDGQKMAMFAIRATENYSGYSPILLGRGHGDFDAKRLLKGYAPLAGGVAFYMGTGELAKRVSRGLAA